MSRCFPYPPPGYSLSRASNEALIESIELQKERQQAKEQRKREKRREKEKRKEKKQKRKERKERKEKTNQNLDKSDKLLKGHTGEKYWADTKSEILHKVRASENEQLENSSLTEEHEQPCCLQVPSSSSDSTENTNKRKRLSLPIDGCSRHGNIIKIKLSKKKNECDASASEHPCTTAGRIDFLAQTKGEISFGVTPQNLSCKSNGTGNIVQGFPLRTDKEQMCSTSGLIDAAAPATPSSPIIVTGSMLQYKDLVENWLPPQLQYTCLDPDDHEWLFQNKNQNVCPEKRFRSGDNSISCSSSSALWPHGQYLHDADVYALPFTVPF